MWALNYPESLWGVNMRHCVFCQSLALQRPKQQYQMPSESASILSILVCEFIQATQVSYLKFSKKKTDKNWNPLGREQCRLRLLPCHPSSSSIMSKCLPQQPVLLTTRCFFEDKDNPVKFLSGSHWLRSETTLYCEPLDLTLCLCLGSTIARHLAILGAFPHKLNQVTALHRDPSIFYGMLKFLYRVLYTCSFFVWGYTCWYFHADVLGICCNCE